MTLDKVVFFWSHMSLTFLVNCFRSDSRIEVSLFFKCNDCNVCF